MAKRELLAGATAALVLIGAGCEPTSVTEAREQIARNAQGVLEFNLALTDTTYAVGELLAEEDTVTTPTGLLGIRVQRDSLTAVDYAQFLITGEVSTSVAAPGPAIGFVAPGGQRDTLAFQTPQGSQVTGATIQDGYIVRSIVNNTGCSGTVSISVVDSLGTVVVAFPDLVVADGATVVDSLDAAGASFDAFLDVAITAELDNLCMPVPGASVETTITARPLTLTSVALDQVDETIGIEESREVDGAQIDFDDLESSFQQATLNDATVSMTIRNSADLPVSTGNLTLGVVAVTADGQLMRDPGGEPLYEESSPGVPLLVPVTDPGEASLVVAPQATKTLTTAAPELVDRAVHMVLDGERVAIVIAGDATGGDGTPVTLTRQDAIDIEYEIVVGFDITVPPSGVTFTRVQTLDGADLEPEDASSLAERVISAGVRAAAVNGTSFGAQVELALVPDSVGDEVDVFARPDAVILALVSLDTPTVDSNGLPTSAVSDSVAVALSGSEAQVVLGRIFTAGIRVTLTPGSGGGGRAAVRPGDGVALDAVLNLQIRRGSQ